MAGIKSCKDCGVPLLVSSGQTWFDNGVIAEAKNPDHRLLFYESDNLDSLVDKISGIIGVPIEHIVVESKRKATRQYLEKMISRTVRKMVYLVRPTIMANRMADMAMAYGCGKIQLVELNRSFRKGGKEDYIIVTIQYPYSIYFFRGDNLGGMEASSGFECTETTTEIDGKEDMYSIDIRVGTHPPELLERLPEKRYSYKSGDVRYERCPRCGVPMDVARYHWDKDKGMITEPATGRRVSIFTSGGMEGIFEELEAELGEDIPRVIIEAQRRYVKSSFVAGEWGKEVSDFRHMLAVRGLGMLSDFAMDSKHAAVTVENSCVPLFMVGMIQGLYELESGNEKTTYDWELDGNGDLRIEVTAAPR